MIIGIASYGDVLAGAEIIRQRYIPARFIHDLFTSRIPPSTNITAQTACKKINELTYLTTFDLREMFPPQSQSTTSQEVCNCCCDALQKTSANAYSPPPMEHCAPALFCSRHTLALAMNKLKLALMNNNAGPETESAYLGVRRQFVSLDVGLLPVPERIELLDAFASTGTLVATYKQNVSADVAGTAAKDALTAYKNRVALGETPETYFQLGKTLQLTGDKSKSDAANALAYIITDTPSDRTDLKIAEKELRKKALKDIPSKFEDVKQ